MKTAADLAEYRALCAALGVLRGTYLQKREEVRGLLAEVFALKRTALRALAKANRLTGRLSGRQRQVCGVSYRLCEIEQRLNEVSRYSPAVLQSLSACGGGFAGGANGVDDGTIDFGGDGSPLADCPGRGEIKARGLAVLGMIDRVKKSLLQFELLERRCRELILSIDKVMKAFHHELKNIRREIYPLGLLSRLHRRVRSLFGSGYFSFRDMEGMAALGNITGCVLKIADSPLI